MHNRKSETEKVVTGPQQITNRRQNTSITTMPPLQHQHTRHTSSLQLHPHTHHIVTPGFADRPRRSDCTAGQMDGEAGWWTTCGNIGLPPLARVMGVGRQQGGPLREATPPPQIYKGIRRLQDKTLHKRTTAVIQLPEVWPQGQDLQVRCPDLQVFRRKTRIHPVQGQQKSVGSVQRNWKP